MKLELYVLDGCPYCAKVERYVAENGLGSEITRYEIESDDAACDRLTQMNGSDQVPCLVMDGKPMLESDDIIEWLGNNLVKGQKTA